jgi:NAD(P)-dependent dehydrogenase (short-subunit alcohol dehydrogenase family)
MASLFRVSKIDYMFLNAGMLPIKDIDVLSIFKSSPIELFRTGGNVIRQKTHWCLASPHSWPSTQPISTVFVANVLGHYTLIVYLLPYFVTGHTKLIWTSSSTANKRYFSIDDPQHLKG